MSNAPSPDTTWRSGSSTSPSPSANAAASSSSSTRATQPVTGLESTIKAEVIKDSQTRQLEISARDEDPGAYESVFIPTVAGPYTFHLTGTIEGNAIDESFTSKPGGFDEIHESAALQWPVQFPSQAQLVADTQSAKDAAWSGTDRARRWVGSPL